MSEFPTLADLETAPPGPAQAPPPPSRTRQILDWLESEGYRCGLDDDGDIHLRHEGRDVYVLLDSEDLAYLRFLVPDVWRCDADPEERSVALVVGNSINGELKALKLSLRPSGAVAASIELFLDGFEAFQKVAPRCLDLLGTGAWEFRSRMRSSIQKAAADEPAAEELVEEGCPDDVEGLP